MSSEINLLFLELRASWWVSKSWFLDDGIQSACSQQLLLPSLTASNFLIYQTIQLCLSHSLILTFPTVSLRVCNLHQQIVAKLDFLLFTPDPPFLSGYDPRKSLCSVSSESPPQSHINQSIPREGMGMKGDSCHYYINYNKFITSDHGLEEKWIWLPQLRLNSSVSICWAVQMLRWTSDRTQAETYLKSSYTGS